MASHQNPLERLIEEAASLLPIPANGGPLVLVPTAHSRQAWFNKLQTLPAFREVVAAVGTDDTADLLWRSGIFDRMLDGTASPDTDGRRCSKLSLGNERSRPYCIWTASHRLAVAWSSGTASRLSHSRRTNGRLSARWLKPNTWTQRS